jgi:hypothetical protein
MVWCAVGWGVCAIEAGFWAASFRLHSYEVFVGTPTVILALYGAAWAVVATVSGRRWMLWVALGAYLGAIAIGLLVNNPLIFLAYAAALLLLISAPGLVLMQRKD